MIEKVKETTFPDEIIEDGKVRAYWDEELECYIYLDPNYEKKLSTTLLLDET